MNPALNSYLRMLAGPVDGRAGRWLDVRWPQPSSPSGMGRDFLPAAGIDQAGVLIERVARHVDVYIGIALHDREAGDRTSVSRSHLVWADIDDEDAQSSLDRFRYPPTMTVASGSPGRRHSYWLLSSDADIDEVMTANRKLAGWLGGDLSSGLSRVSMLRPAGTYNYKHQPRQPVRIVDLAGSRVYDLSQLVDGLGPKPRRTVCWPIWSVAKAGQASSTGCICLPLAGRDARRCGCASMPRTAMPSHRDRSVGGAVLAQARALLRRPARRQTGPST